MPSPTTTDYFKTDGGGFINHGKDLRYALNFNLRKPVNGSAPWFAEVQFENPADPSGPMIQFNEYRADEKAISITSSEVRDMKNHRTYKVTVKAYSDLGRLNLIATHDMYVRLDVPDQLAPSFGIK